MHATAYCSRFNEALDRRLELMAAVLSTGFCRFVDSFSDKDAGAPSDEQQVWQKPILQLVDIQAFAGHQPAMQAVYYLALSDGQGLIWCIAPPGSRVERHIRDLELEVGCCIGLDEYALVRAKNGRNVAVALAVAVSQTPVSLIGAPEYDSELFKLSPSSVMRQLRASGKGMDAAFAAPPVTIADIIAFGPSPEASSRYTLVGRVLWKSKLRRLVPSPEGFGGGGRDTASGRYVFDIKLVDRNGDAIKVVFWGSKKHFDTVSVGDCVIISDSTVQWSEDASGPVALQVGDKAGLEILPEDVALPYAAARDIGACAAPFVDIRRVCEESQPGDVVCCQGVVTISGPVIATSTKRGQVDRLTVTIRDRSSSHAVELTLWDAHARDAQFHPGKLYFFRDVVVRMFGTKKVLSSRSSSEVFEPPAALMGSNGAAAPEISLTYAPPTQTSVPFTVDLNMSSETVPVVLRIQAIKLPIFYTACSDCGRQANANELCPNCSCGDHELRFLVRMVLSDGLQCINATGFTFVGESLFGETTASFLEKLSCTPRYDADAITSLSGLPVLVKLVRSLDGDAHVVELAHLDLAACAGELAQIIAEY